MLTPAHQLPDHPRLTEQPLVVMALCAEWCGTCRDFQPVLERIAAAHPQWMFAWADIEADADLVGDVDVDNFPTLAVFRAGRTLHFGATLPLENVVARLLQGIQDRDGTPGDVPVEVAALGVRLAG